MYRIKTDLPIMQTPMRGMGSINLVAAVSQAGGMGTLDASDLSAKQLEQSIQKIRELTNKPFCIHLTVPQPYEATQDQVDIVKQALRPYFFKQGLGEPELEAPFTQNFTQQMDVLLKSNVPMFQFSCGIPALKWLEALKQQEIVILGTASHLDEARVLQKVGVDAIVCQALEAYGERATFLGEPYQAMIPRDILLAELAQHSSVPLIINGGIATAEDVSQSLALGATRVQVALPLLACPEARLDVNVYKKLFSQKPDMVFSNAVTGRPARVVCNEIVDELLHYKPFMLPYPLQFALIKPLFQRHDLLFSEELSSWTERMPVAELLSSLAVETEAVAL